MCVEKKNGVVGLTNRIMMCMSRVVGGGDDCCCCGSTAILPIGKQALVGRASDTNLFPRSKCCSVAWLPGILLVFSRSMMTSSRVHRSPAVEIGNLSTSPSRANASIVISSLV